MAAEVAVQRSVLQLPVLAGLLQAEAGEAVANIAPASCKQKLTHCANDRSTSAQGCLQCQ